MKDYERTALENLSRQLGDFADKNGVTYDATQDAYFLGRKSAYQLVKKWLDDFLRKEES